jgi:2-polyprenyl-6-methoxyphenol hydroxylase-like FAD-dependent oxidoreductase
MQNGHVMQKEQVDSKHIVVVGGSIAGLGAAFILSQDGYRVTVLEEDATPLPPSPLEAFERWDRRGSPQTRHSHAFLARLHSILRRRAPDLLETLLEHGVEELRFPDMARAALGRDDLELSPEDDEITLLACRRITFEWVLRRYVIDSGRVTFRDGVEVLGLVAENNESEVPRVTGVRLREAGGATQTLDAHLVLDASGRRSSLRAWLEEIGAATMEKDSEPCGIFYCSRFYKLLSGSTDADTAGSQAETPARGGVMASDLGYMKYGIFPGDAGIFSITLCASPDDDDMRRILRTPVFEEAVRALSATSEWVEPTVSEPISDVHAMANLNNSRCHFVVGGEPLALGVFPIGDALIHTNPLNGRGCTLAFINAELVADALRDHPDDPRAFARTLDASVEREIVPWYEATLAQDRNGIAVSRAQQRGEDPFAFQREDGTVDTAAYMRALLRDGLLPVMREDLGMLRTFMRVFNLLEAPTDLMRDPQIMQRVIASFERRNERQPEVRGPSRDEMIGRLAAVSS